MTWRQIAGAGVLAASAVALFIWGPVGAEAAAAGALGAAAVVLGGGLAKRGPQ